MSAPEPGIEARRIALEVLARVEDDDAYANLVLSSVLDRPSPPGPNLSNQDRGLITDLVYGTLRRQRAVDYLADRFLSSDPPPSARRALRLGAYQLVFRTDIPAYAAVDATVSAVSKRFRPLINAVLRKISAGDPAGRAITYPDEPTRLSYPDWMVDRLRADLGDEDARGALEAMNESGHTTVREDGYVQDLASQWVAAEVGAEAGELVVDLCAAPGGKATAMAAGGAVVVASDLQPHRVGLIRDNARRLGLAGVVPMVADALSPPFAPGSADRVLVDAPCSGLGVLRRRPDARWRLDAASPERLADLQRRLVDRAVGLLAQGGTLVYSVCTLTAVESLGVDDHIARRHPQLLPLEVPGDPWQPWGRGALLLPQRAGTDGMCLFRYRSTKPD